MKITTGFKWGTWLRCKEDEKLNLTERKLGDWGTIIRGELRRGTIRIWGIIRINTVCQNVLHLDIIDARRNVYRLTEWY